MGIAQSIRIASGMNAVIGKRTATYTAAPCRAALHARGGETVRADLTHCADLAERPAARIEISVCVMDSLILAAGPAAAEAAAAA